MSSIEGEAPTEKELSYALKEIEKLLVETTDKIDTVRGELLEALEDNTKEISAQIQQIKAFQSNILEANQKKIWSDGIGAIISRLDDLEKPKEDAKP